jgi:hypothetical protein
MEEGINETEVVQPILHTGGISDGINGFRTHLMAIVRIGGNQDNHGKISCN